MDADKKVRTFAANGHIVPSNQIIKTPDQIKKIRESCEVNIAILDYVSEKIKIGISTEEINQLVFDKTKELGGFPASLGYNGYHKSVCTSLNDEVCHGVPSEDRFLADGDIVNIDVSTNYKNYFSDSSRMFCIGNVSEKKRHLVQTAKESVELGLREAKPWGFLGDIAQVINEYVKQHGYSVVREIGGHGIGLQFHEDPWVGYTSNQGTGMLLVPGMIFTIEPMVNMGTDKVFTDKKNGWTVYTADHEPSAQWEIMVLITEEGNEILAY